jgi:hypothetical protein
MQQQPLRSAARPLQFSIAAILEYTAVCSVLLAFAPCYGVAPCAFLMAMALALRAKQGDLAMLMLIGASISTGLGHVAGEPDNSLGSVCLVQPFAVLICAWNRRKSFAAAIDISP